MENQVNEIKGGHWEYYSLTRTATYSYLAALPLFLAYEILDERLAGLVTGAAGISGFRGLNAS